MLTLENKENYLKNCGLTETFLDENYLKEKVFYDYNLKMEKNPNYTILHSLFNWINKNLKMSKDREFILKNKFQRSAKEIWESRLTTGCTDYAIVFATLARQLNIPTTILHTMSQNFIETLKLGNALKHTGHAFCECYINNKWVLIDPANCNFVGDYCEDKIKLNYTINSENIFIPCDRNVDFKNQSIKEFNQKMDLLCLDLQV